MVPDNNQVTRVFCLKNPKHLQWLQTPSGLWDNHSISIEPQHSEQFLLMITEEPTFTSHNVG